MPPIPVHIEDPITPAKAQPATPQTQADQSSTSAAPGPITAASTPTSTSSYPLARPGAAAVPAPTSAIPKPQPAPTRTYIPEQSDLPPPPQPGAAPRANATAFQSNATAGQPPPTAGFSASAPPQAQWTSPQQNYAPTHSTNLVTPHAAQGPTTLEMGPVMTSPSSHPPGYQQNAYAQDLSPAQRASLDQQEAREKQGNMFGDLAAPQTGDTAENAWNAVKSFGAKATDSVGKVHGEVWKWIDGKP